MTVQAKTRDTAATHLEIESGTQAVMTISLAAIADNYKFIVSHAKGAQVAAVVKANAYGLGIDAVAPALWGAGARTFFVATLSEAVVLRGVLSDAVIYVLNGVAPPDKDICTRHDITPVINDPSMLEMWRGSGHAVAVHVDTGLNRLGFNYDDFAQADFSDINASLLLSHLACADTPENPMNVAQRTLFAAASKKLPGVPLSLAASDGIFCGPEFHFNMVRPGAALYGINPTPSAQNPMQPVVTLRAPVLQTRRVAHDGTVGYVATHAVTRGQILATVGIGYADGLLRTLGNVGRVYVGKTPVPVVGRVSMDVITLDVTALGDTAPKPGDFLDILNTLQTPDDLARAAGTNGYEIMTALGHAPRLRKIYLS